DRERRGSRRRRGARTDWYGGEWDDVARRGWSRQHPNHATARASSATFTFNLEKSMVRPLTASEARLHFAVTPFQRGVPMPILTIRNVPDELYGRLKASASERRRSLNSEVIECLQVGLAARRPREVEGFL